MSSNTANENERKTDLKRARGACQHEQADRKGRMKAPSLKKWTQQSCDTDADKKDDDKNENNAANACDPTTSCCKLTNRETKACKKTHHSAPQLSLQQHNNNLSELSPSCSPLMPFHVSLGLSHNFSLTPGPP